MIGKPSILALSLAMIAVSACAQTYSPAPPAYAPPPPAASYPPAAAAPGGYPAAPANPAVPSRPPPSPQLIAARRAMRQACAADIQKLCTGADAAGEKPLQCLHQRMAQASPACIQAFQTMRADRAAAPR